MRCYRRPILIATAVALLVSVTGCGGMVASPSVSPASFLLPGLVEASPGAKDVPVTSEAPQPELALAR